MAIRDWEALRKEAITLRFSTGTPTEVCRSLKVSRDWFYKWLGRYERDPDGPWYLEAPRAPRRTQNKTPQNQERKVVAVRKQLENDPYAQTGAFSIEYALRELGDRDVPKIWTINRILKRNHCIEPGNQRYRPKGKVYPAFPPGPWRVNTIHQFDIYGPRYLEGAVVFYAHNLMDVSTHRAGISIQTSKQDTAVIDALACSWEVLGFPEYLQIDNQMCMRGSNRHPRALGKVIRFCLRWGVTPIFIPLQEPWRNGMIERFQGIFRKKLYDRIRVSGLEEMRTRGRELMDFHNQNHRYAVLGLRTPNAMATLLPPARRPIRRSIPHDQLLARPTTGQVHLIRFIRSNARLDVFGERFPVPKSLVYEYVRASLLVKEQRIQVFHQNRLVHEIPYCLRN